MASLLGWLSFAARAASASSASAQAGRVLHLERVVALDVDHGGVLPAAGDLLRLAERQLGGSAAAQDRHRAGRPGRVLSQRSSAMCARPIATRTLSYLTVTPAPVLLKLCSSRWRSADSRVARARRLQIGVRGVEGRELGRRLEHPVRRAEHLDRLRPGRKEVAGVRAADESQTLDLAPGGPPRRPVRPGRRATGRRRSPGRSPPPGRTGAGRRRIPPRSSRRPAARCRRDPAGRARRRGTASRARSPSPPTCARSPEDGCSRIRLGLGPGHS